MITIILLFGVITIACIVQIKKKSNIRDKIFIVVLLMFFLTIPFFIIKSNYELNTNIKFTKGIVDSFKYNQSGRYSLNYYFHVNGKKYTGSTSTYNFNCSNNDKCIGNKFTIAYSEKDPTNNEINLNEFEKHRADTRFFEIDWKLAK